MLNSKKHSLNYLRFANILITTSSVVISCFLMLLRLPGMELLGISPNWLLIWVVAWGMKRRVWQGAIAGIALGYIADGLSVASPSHILSLFSVGVLTASLQKHKYIGEDFISVALIVFFMTIVAETTFAIQYVGQEIAPLDQIWQQYQRITITSAIINSLWSPAFYYPCDRWWSRVRYLEKMQSRKSLKH